MPESALLRTIANESAVWAIGLACREGGLPFSSEVVRQSCPEPHDLCGVRGALVEMGMEVMLFQGMVEHTQDDAICFVLLEEGSSIEAAAVRGSEQAGDLRLARMQRSPGGEIRLQYERLPQELTLSAEAFRRIYTGYALRVRPSAPEFDTTDVATDRHDDRFGMRWFVREMRRYRAVWVEVLVAALGIQVLALVVPLLTQTVIDKVMVHRTASTLVVIAVAFVAATLFSALLTWLRQYFVLHAGTRIDAVLAADVFAHLLRLPSRYFEQRPTGVLVARMHAVETIREFLTGAALILILDVPFMLIFAAIMYHYSAVLAVIAVVLLGVIVLVSALATPPLRRAINAQFLAGARQQAFVTERIAAIETVKSLQLEPALDRRFESLYGRYVHAGLRTRLLSASIGIGTQSIEQMLSLSILCAGAWMVVEGGGLTIGGLIACQMFAARMTAPALKIAGLWQEFQQVYVAVQRLADIMDAPREPMRFAGSRSVVRNGLLQCAGLGFRYRNGPWLFRDVSFELRPGECAAVVGRSGSGKTTFARVLQGFCLPAEGSLRIDGADTIKLAANEVRSYLGVVPQETRLFAGTVLQNLIEAAPSADLDRVLAACRAAGIHDAIDAMPDGYYTGIGENGVGLSGGQKQRLAIARALLKGARILVFDEPMSSLDGELAEGLVDTINGLRGEVSVIFIGHRLPERLRCDVVITMGTANEAAQ